MTFDVADMRVTELARILDTQKASVTRYYKSRETGELKTINNRIVGIEPEAVERLLREKGHDDFYESFLIILATQTGGCGKTSTTANLAAATRRMTGRDKAVVLIDTDSQASLTEQLLGKPADDNSPILNDWLSSKASLEECLVGLGDNTWLIPSRLENIYLDKTMAAASDVKKKMKILVEQIFAKFGEGTKIFLDTPPQLSAIGQSAVCAMAQIKQKSHLLIPVRSDLFSIKGARICITETRETLDTFGFKKPSFPIDCFLSAYDARVKASIETMRHLFEDPILKNHLSPVTVRYSSEVTKSAYARASVFKEISKRTSNITSDYTDLLLYTLGWKGLDQNG